VTTQCFRAFFDFSVVTNVAFVTTSYVDLAQCLQGLSRCHDLLKNGLKFTVHTPRRPTGRFDLAGVVSPCLTISGSFPPSPERFSRATVPSQCLQGFLHFRAVPEHRNGTVVNTNLNQCLSALARWHGLQKRSRELSRNPLMTRKQPGKRRVHRKSWPRKGTKRQGNRRD